MIDANTLLQALGVVVAGFVAMAYFMRQPNCPTCPPNDKNRTQNTVLPTKTGKTIQVQGESATDEIPTNN
jgi:hypothetical protein